MFRFILNFQHKYYFFLSSVCLFVLLSLDMDLYLFVFIFFLFHPHPKNSDLTMFLCTSPLHRPSPLSSLLRLLSTPLLPILPDVFDLHYNPPCSNLHSSEIFGQVPASFLRGRGGSTSPPPTSHSLLLPLVPLRLCRRALIR